LQCIQGESKEGCSPDLIEKVREASLFLRVAFSEKRIKHPYYELLRLDSLSPLEKTESLYRYLARAASQGYIDEKIADKIVSSQDLHQKYELLSQEVFLLVGLLINNFVLHRINNYFTEKIINEANITEEEANEILPEEEL